MLAYRYPLIAREGWLWIAIAVIVAGIVHITVGIASSMLLWAVVLFLLFLFRDPSRQVPASPLGIVCPVDGKIVAIEKVRDAYLGRTATCISIKMGIADVYSAHSPMEGKIVEQWMGVPRMFKSITSAKPVITTKDVTTYAQWIQSDEEDDVVLVMETSAMLPRPQCYAQSGERIGQGQRCGFLRFGTRVDVLLPETTRIDVTVGSRVRAGADIIATLVRRNVASESNAEVAHG